MNNMKLAVLSMGFLFLFSCTGDVTGGPAFLNSSLGNKSHEKMGKNSKEKVNKPRGNEILPGAVIPFFFGAVEATLR